MKRTILILTAVLYFYPLITLSDLIVLSDTVDDATLTLTIEDQVVLGTSDWASVQIEVVDTDVPLTLGDTVTVELFDDDLASDDLLFSTSFIVTAAEAAAGFFGRTIDAVFDAVPFLPDIDNTLEIFARALVDKVACGFGCLFDEPETSPASVTFFESPPPPPPDVTVVSDVVDDATLTLSIFDEVVIGSADWASIRIEINDGDVPLTLGDTVLIELFDDDLVGDDLLFSTFFSVTADEVLAGLVDRMFDAVFDPSPFLPDFDNTLEIFARAFVDKNACGFGCFFDDPETSIVSVAFIENISEVPEPSTLMLMGIGLVGLGWMGRQRNKHQ